MTKKVSLPEGVELPKHVAIIPDGNRRWAREKGLTTVQGHRKGFDRAVEAVRASRQMGIHTLTLWAFSTENWSRSKREIDYLMRLYHDMIDDNLKEAHKYKAKMVHLGRKDRIPKSLAEKVAKAEAETGDYRKHILNMALDYGGQDELLRAIVRMVAEVPSSKLRDPGFLFKEIGSHGKYPVYRLADYLDTAGQPYPYPDLMIRTSGELRTSGLLLWQSAYAEFYFEEKCFPDFTAERFREAVIDFSRRQRRYGGN